MPFRVVSPSGRYSLSLSEDDQVLILAALSETLEEGAQPYSQMELRRLCALHGRLSRVLRLNPDYVFRRGKVVSACRPSEVIAGPIKGQTRVVTF
jgi:hypothetical protein